MDKQEETQVSVQDLNIENLLGNDGGQEKKKGLFDDLMQTDEPFSSFIDTNSNSEEKESETKEPEADEPEEKKDKKKEQPSDEKDTEQDPMKSIIENDDEPVKNKKVLSSVIKDMINDGTLYGIDGDDRDIDELSQSELKELLELNLQETKRLASEQAPEEFFKSLPQEIQAAIYYTQHGGQDIKSVLRSLSYSKEISDFDISDTEGQRALVAAYLKSTNYGTDEEIEDEVMSYEDRGDLEKKAKQFKPKMEAMQQQIIRQNMERQRQVDERRKMAYAKYIDNIEKSLRKDDLNGTHLTNKTRNMLYSGLTKAEYKLPNGQRANQLFYLIDKYTNEGENQGMLAEALWLLSDPDGYREAVKTSIAKEVNTKTAMKLKTEQQARNTDTSVETRHTIKKPMRNIFE